MAVHPTTSSGSSTPLISHMNSGAGHPLVLGKDRQGILAAAGIHNKYVAGRPAKSPLGWQVRVTPPGLWEVRRSNRRAAERKDPFSQNPWLTREPVGAVRISNISIRDSQPIPINVADGSDAIDRYENVCKQAKKILEDSEIYLRDLLAIIHSGEVGTIDSADLKYLKSLLGDGFPKWLEAYEVWWTLATENNSLSQLRSEYLYDLVRDAQKNHLKDPVVAKITLPFSKLNSVLDASLATQIKWDVLGMCKTHFGADPGVVTFIDSTGIALALPEARYSREKLEDFLKNFNSHLETYFKARLEKATELPGIRRKEERIEVLLAKGIWMPLAELLSEGIFAGVARVATARYTDMEQKLRAVHTAEIIARARAEKIKEITETQGVGNPSNSVLDDATEADQLELGRGAIPDGHIPDKDNLLLTLFQIYRRQRLSKIQPVLPTYERGYKRFANTFSGLRQIYAVCELVAGEYPDRNYSASQYFAAIFTHLDGSNANSAGFASFVYDAPDALDVFCDGIIDLVKNKPLKSAAVHQLIHLGGQRNFIHKARQYVGALEKVRSAHQLLLAESDVNPTLLLKELKNSLVQLRHLLKGDLSDSLNDPRFAGKVKYRAFALKLANIRSPQRLNLVVLDYDNLRAYFTDPRNAVHPEQVYDSAKFRIERLIMQAAEKLQITNDVRTMYASPGGDEIVISLPPQTNPDGFIQIMRELMEELFKDILFAAERKVYFTTDEGLQGQRWPVYQRTTDGAIIAVDLADQQKFENFLSGTAPVDSNETVRIFRVLAGMEQGGMMVSDMPLSALAGYQRKDDRVGISATAVRIPGRGENESVSEYAARIDGEVDLALELVGRAKSWYAKNRTWGRLGPLAVGIMTGFFDLEPHHVGYDYLIKGAAAAAAANILP